MVTVDFVGRVNNTPLSPRQGLSPVFEAIFNSIQAIQEANKDNGEIQITVKRETEGLLFKDDDQIRLASIYGFEICDNGVGFDSGNYSSFTTCDTQKKRLIGGKGIGRFLWLKAFEIVKINSIYQEKGSRFSRSFSFILNNEPITDHINSQVPDDTQIQTVVYLQKLKQEFAEHIPRSLDILAYRIIEHCLEYFVLGTMPKITIRDENDYIVLNEKYAQLVSDDSRSEFDVNGHHFIVTHFILQAIPNIFHKLNFCAVHRVVCTKKLDSKVICNLPTRIPARDDSRDLLYLGYISSPFLDAHVNQQRTGFDTISEGQFQFVGELSWGDIEEKAIQAVKNFLEPITAPIGVKKLNRIQEYIAHEAPEFRGLLKHRQEAIREIPPDIQPERLEVELFKKQKEWEIDLRERADEIITAPPRLPTNNGNEIEEKYIKFLDEWNESGKAALAKYVVHRKTTLTLLEKYIQSDEDGGYARERTIHQLIFPLKHTSDNIDYEQQNLWVIDERLSFHRYLSSDLELRQVELIDSGDLDRPDLLVFDNPIAVVEGEPINGVSIFEFKRPMRRDSNPVSQMYGYVRKIRAGNALSNRNRLIVVREETPFYCYAICDLTNSLRTELEDMVMQKTPDNEGYFCYNSTYRAYVEVISYSKLLRDAQQRNRILFEKLNISK